MLSLLLSSVASTLRRLDAWASDPANEHVVDGLRRVLATGAEMERCRRIRAK